MSKRWFTCQPLAYVVAFLGAIPLWLYILATNGVHGALSLPVFIALHIMVGICYLSFLLSNYLRVPAFFKAIIAVFCSYLANTCVFALGCGIADPEVRMWMPILMIPCVAFVTPVVVMAWVALKVMNRMVSEGNEKPNNEDAADRL